MIAKVATILVWLLCIANIILEFPDPAGQILFGLMVFLLCAHTIECLVFSGRVLRAEGSTFGHFIQLFLFGYFHAMTLPE